MNPLPSIVIPAVPEQAAQLVSDLMTAVNVGCLHRPVVFAFRNALEQERGYAAIREAFHNAAQPNGGNKP